MPQSGMLGTIIGRLQSRPTLTEDKDRYGKFDELVTRFFRRIDYTLSCDRGVSFTRSGGRGWDRFYERDKAIGRRHKDISWSKARRHHCGHGMLPIIQVTIVGR